MTSLFVSAVVATCLAAPAFAWTLDNTASVVSYASIKNAEIAEPNTFTGLSGAIEESGKAVIEIPLSSVDTHIEIRNERVRDILFEVADFPVATISAELDLDDLSGLAVGASEETEFDLTLDTHGAQQSYDAKAIVIRASENRVVVVSKEPVIVHADDFGYLAGLNKLRDIAGLDSIQPVVPVSFALTFDR